MTADKNRYRSIIAHVFKNHYRPGADRFEFEREELAEAGKALNVSLPKNLGDIVYSFRYRMKSMPSALVKRCEPGMKWIIEGVGTGKYRFRMVPATTIEPQPGRYRIKIPDSTPEIVAEHAQSDEQALLAKIRYNRLIDVFTGLVTYSMQNHLRTTVSVSGSRTQIEVDELYVGISKDGAQFVLPVQAKGQGESLGRTQLEQDLRFCRERFPNLIPRAIGAQFLDDDVIVMFELDIQEDDVRVVEERHYVLVPASDISQTDLETMRRRLRAVDQDESPDPSGTKGK